MTDDVWAEASPDERIERAASRLLHLFSTQDLGPDAWDGLSDAAKESWREAARQVLRP